MWGQFIITAEKTKTTKCFGKTNFYYLLHAHKTFHALDILLVMICYGKTKQFSFIENICSIQFFRNFYKFIALFYKINNILT